MPFIDNSPIMTIFFNVVNSVGRNAMNRLDDVRMVQYMLASYYNTRPDIRPPGEMTVDNLGENFVGRRVDIQHENAVAWSHDVADPARREFENAMIEHWNTSFQTHSHGGAVQLH